MFVAIFVFTIVFSIALHELGHFVTAKAFGMKAERYFIGFGPTVWSRHVGETEYGLKAIPAGGFVKIAGMTPWEEVDPADDGRLFYQQKPWKRVIVLSAGSATHLVLAFLLLIAGLAFVGLPMSTNEVAMVVEDSPGAAAGLEPGDVIVAVDGQAVDGFAPVRDIVEGAAGETLALEVLRDGETITTEAVLDAAHPDPERAGAGFLGVAPEGAVEPLGLVDGTRTAFSPSASVEITGRDYSMWFMTRATVDGLTRIFSLDGLTSFCGSVAGDEPRPAESATSLVGAGQIVNELGNQGDVFAVLVVLAQLNLVLGLLNMLPLPPLDGGHVAVLAVEESVEGVRKLRKDGRSRPKFRLNPSVVTPIALAVIAFFVVLTGTALYLDITQPASQLVQ